jgi:L-alanine-DL-glutamate epimerase-like enolase superfamily enzyme
MLYKMELPWPILQNEPRHRQRSNIDAIFRIDANCGWEEETIKNAISLKKLGVEFLEQPMKADNWE